MNESGDDMRWTNDSKSSNECWLVIGGGTTLGRGQELTHSPFTFSLHSRGERKQLIHAAQSHTHTQTYFRERRVKHTYTQKALIQTHTHYTREAIKSLFTQHVYTHITVCSKVDGWRIQVCENYVCVPTTYHDYVSGSDTDLIMAASIKWIYSPVVDHLHWLLLVKATGWCLLVEQTGYRSFLRCK